MSGGNLANALVASGTILIGLILAEGAARITEGAPLTQLELPVRLVNIGRDTTAQRLDQVARAPSVEPAWFFTDPPPLPNRMPVSAEAKAVDQALMKARSPFLPTDAFKAWNSALVGNPCNNPVFANAPGWLMLFDPEDGNPNPPFRFLANTTTPVGLVTNELGWRGPPMSFERAPNTIRIVFVGASTTVDAHQMPYSYPEFIGHWLNLWAAKNHLEIKFEVANAARESIGSKGIESIVRTEVAPTRPDLVIYHEGGNQFQLASVVSSMPTDAASLKPTPAMLQAKPPNGWLAALARYSDIARRIQTLVVVDALPSNAAEAAKPGYELTWPQGLSESDPDLTRADLPVRLAEILGDLDVIRVDLAPVGAELAVTSFLWMVKDGLTVDPIRNRLLWEYLNIYMYPYRYRDLERLAVFQNVVLEKYAKTRGIDFIDVAGKMPFDSDLYADGVHTTYPGTRMKGWVILQQLIPIVEARLKSGAWPKAPPAMTDIPAVFRTPPRRIEVNCKRELGSKNLGQ